ncbi:MAG TPA: NAD(P)-dependent oxidoreductase [Saprospiraceae bacterium]|nr:NAD(P)-dependent oxidoreductase [Saprospiraceae bacterium]
MIVNMPQKDVLVTDYVHPVLLKGLKDLGYQVTYAPEMTKVEMDSYLPNYKGVVINTRCAIDRPSLENSPQLHWIARLGSGLDIIDLDAAAEKNIHVISAPEGNAEAVAEHAMGMLLSLANNLIPSDQQVRNGLWLREQNRGWEIAGKTIGIIGYGNNGSAFGRLWKGWDVRVLAYDKYLERYGDDKVIAVDLDALLDQADIISLHVPLTGETLNMVNEQFISGCKSGCVIINTSRGKVIDVKSLLHALQSGKIKGACLDVLEYEPPLKGSEEFKKIFAELCQLDNVVLSPHVAGWTVESKMKIAEVILSKLRVVPGR